MVNKILVMGATGKVGHEVVKYLSQQKVKVKAAVHQPKNAAILANLGVEIVPFDISQPETIQQAFTDVKKLFLLIPSIDTESEIAMAQYIIDYADPAGLTHAQVAEILSTVSNHKIMYTAKSDEDTRLALRDCGWTEEGIEKFLPLFKGIQQGEFSPVQTTDIANILGRSPISFQQYAEDYQKFWK